MDTPTNAEILAELRKQYFVAIQNPKPTYQLGEIKVDHNGFLKHLSEQIKQFEALAQDESIAIEETFYI
jgi:hypothetical protein